MATINRSIIRALSIISPCMFLLMMLGHVTSFTQLHHHHHHVASNSGRRIDARMDYRLNVADKKASSHSSKQDEKFITTGSDDILDSLTRGKQELVDAVSPSTSTQTTTSTILDLSLEIGGIDIDENDDTEPILMGINHLIVSLCNKAVVHNENNEEYVKLPGADSNNKLKSKYSTGHLHLNVLQQGSFVTLEGTQYVDTNRGCYEIHRMKNKPAGQLVIGFEIPKTYRRNKFGKNQCCLPKGIIYISFPIWSKHGLLYAQNEKQRIENELQQLQDDYENAMYHIHNDLSQDYHNPIMKIIHMHNAHVAETKYCHHIDNTQLLDCIPNSIDNDKMIKMRLPPQSTTKSSSNCDTDESDDDENLFLLSSRGMIYQQEESIDNKQQQQHRLIGFCNAISKQASTAAKPSDSMSEQRRSRLMP